MFVSRDYEFCLSRGIIFNHLNYLLLTYDRCFLLQTRPLIIWSTDHKEVKEFSTLFIFLKVRLLLIYFIVFHTRPRTHYRPFVTPPSSTFSPFVSVEYTKKPILILSKHPKCSQLKVIRTRVEETKCTKVKENSAETKF